MNRAIITMENLKNIITHVRHAEPAHARQAKKNARRQIRNDASQHLDARFMHSAACDSRRQNMACGNKSAKFHPGRCCMSSAPVRSSPQERSLFFVMNLYLIHVW